MVTEAVRKSMQGNKRRDTKPEIQVRQMLRALGYPGYRCDWKKAPGHPDIAYPGRKLALFVHGCFWHAHEGCKYASRPSTNTDYWNAKFERNKARDVRVREELEAAGWEVVVIWECELKKDKREQTERYLYEVMRLTDEARNAEARSNAEAASVAGEGDAKPESGEAGCQGEI